MFLVYSNLYFSRIIYNIFFSADNLELFIKILSQELNKLRSWLAVNKLALNINNSNYMEFGKGRVPIDIAIAVNQNII